MVFLAIITEVKEKDCKTLLIILEVRRNKNNKPIFFSCQGSVLNLAKVGLKLAAVLLS